jgi:hypothetical protein
MEVDPRSEPWFASDEAPAPKTNAEPNQFPNRLVDFVSDEDGITAETTRLEVEDTKPALAVCKPTNAAAASAAAREIEPIFQTPCTNEFPLVRPFSPAPYMPASQTTEITCAT